MSDENLGGEPPKRPGMNAEGGDATKGENPSQQRSKNRRKRWRKRKKKTGNSVQADIDGNTASADQRVNEGEHSRQNAASPSSDSQMNNASGFGTRNSGARRNRRPGRKQQDQDLPTPSVDTNHPSRGHQQPSRHTPVTGSGKKTPRPRVDAYAALDLGTNNCRLLVAVPQQPGRFRVIDAFSRIVRLGEGLAASGRLSNDAMDRAVEALKTCAEKLNNRKVRGVRLIATEACRQAINGGEFLERVKREAGLELELIDRETEASLAVAGCASLVDREAKGVVLFDIGGGSSELALLDLSKRKRHDLSHAMVSWTSLPLGVVTLSEKYGGGKMVTRPVFEAMVTEVEELLVNFEGKDALTEAAEQGEIHLLGTSGTVTTLAGIHLKLPRYDRRQVDGVWMASKDVDSMIDALVDMSFEERVSNPCIGHDRADLVLAGCAILVAIQRIWPCPRLRVADRGLREGLLTEMMNADNAWQRRHKHNRYRRNKQRKKN